MSTSGKPKSLRDRMPTVAAHIDRLRVQFGAKTFDARLRRAMHGEPVFYAREGSVEFGTSNADLDRWVDNLAGAFGLDFVLIGSTIAPDLPSLTPESTDPCLIDVWIADRQFCAGCDGGCIGKGKRCSEEKATRLDRPRRPSANGLWADPEVVRPVDLLEDCARPDEQKVMEYLGR